MKEKLGEVQISKNCFMVYYKDEYSCGEVVNGLTGTETKIREFRIKPHIFNVVKLDKK